MKKYNFILIALIVFLAGCSTTTNNPQLNYSFDDPDVIAYINGDPVSQTSMDNYVTMKKAYMQAVIDHLELFSDVQVTFPDSIYFKWNNQQTKEIMTYSEDDWEKDYYRSIVLNRKFHDIVKDADEILNNAADEELQYITDYQLDQSNVTDGITIEDDIDGIIIIEDGTITTIGDDITVGAADPNSIDEIPVIASVTNDLDISYYDCFYSVYRPFWISDYIYNYLLNVRFDELDYGDIVEYNGSNDLEYEEYVLYGMEINNNYFDSLLDQAEIVERP